MSDLRTRGNISIPATLSYDEYPVSCANLTFHDVLRDWPLPYVNTGSKETTSSVRTPNYWVRRKRGEFIFNSFYNEKVDLKVQGTTALTQTVIAGYPGCPTVHSTVRKSGSWFLYHYSSIGPRPLTFVRKVLTDSQISSLFDEAWAKLLSERQKGEANYVESLAEIDKSWSMLRNPLENVITFVKDFRLSHKQKALSFYAVKRRARAIAKFASSEYLRFRYGISPLISDCKAAMKALETMYEKEPSIHKTRANASLQDSTSASGSFYADPTTVTYVEKATDIASVRGVYYDRYRATSFDRLGLTFHNVVGVAWELTHFSFVLDWFGNIGDLIYANLPRVNVDALGGSVTMKRTQTLVIAPTSTLNSNPTVWTVSGAMSDSFVGIRTTTQRIAGAELQLKFVINSDFRFDHWTRCGDAVALIIQQLNRVTFR